MKFWLYLVFGIFSLSSVYAAENLSCTEKLNKRFTEIEEKLLATKTAEYLQANYSPSYLLAENLKIQRIYEGELDRVCSALEYQKNNRLVYPVEKQRTANYELISCQNNEIMKQKKDYQLCYPEYVSLRSAWDQILKENEWYKRYNKLDGESYQARNQINTYLFDHLQKDDFVCDNEEVFAQAQFSEKCEQTRQTLSKNAYSMIENQYRLLGSQKETNYYVRKLISLNQRLQDLGQQLFNLGLRMQKVFKQICKC
ncbi:MAG TPA: hypothetical protein PLQ36_01630 [Candidatus Gracilibacteria bacterium]|nr:hypothetical protein [Candidatus Gracilibacteria bacterium]